MISNKIRNIILKQWKKNGVDASPGFFNMFGLNYSKNGNDIKKLVYEYYGGVENVLKRLNKLIDKKIHITDGGYDYYCKIMSFKRWHIDEPIYVEIEVDGDGEVFIFPEDKLENIKDAYNNEDYGWEIKDEMKDSINKWMYYNITEKYGIDLEVDELFVV